MFSVDNLSPWLYKFSVCALCSRYTNTFIYIGHVAKPWILCTWQRISGIFRICGFHLFLSGWFWEVEREKEKGRIELCSWAVAAAIFGSIWFERDHSA